jgi:hypothetical protein
MLVGGLQSSHEGDSFLSYPRLQPTDWDLGVLVRMAMVGLRTLGEWGVENDAEFSISRNSEC